MIVSRIVVLPEPANYGHTAHTKTAPKGRLWMKLLGCFLEIKFLRPPFLRCSAIAGHVM